MLGGAASRLRRRAGHARQHAGAPTACEVIRLIVILVITRRITNSITSITTNITSTSSMLTMISSITVDSTITSTIIMFMPTRWSPDGVRS